MSRKHETAEMRSHGTRLRGKKRKEKSMEERRKEKWAKKDDRLKIRRDKDGEEQTEDKKWGRKGREKVVSLL